MINQVRVISIDAKTHEVIADYIEEVEIDRDPHQAWEEFYEMMADKFIEYMEAKDGPNM